MKSERSPVKDDQLALLWVAPVEVDERSLPVVMPTWAKGCVGDQRRHVLRGRHPTGRAMGPTGERCRGCIHKVTLRYASTYTKCGLDRWKWTKGPASDIKARWPACERWVKKAVER